MRKWAAVLAVCVSSLIIISGCGKQKAEPENTNETATSERKLDKISDDDYWKETAKNLEVRAYDNDARAQYVLGACYDLGVNGVSQNFDTALNWYQSAAKAGYGKADTQLGYMYLNGTGVEKDLNKASDYFTQAQAAGDPEGLVGTALVSLESNPAGREAEIFSNASQAHERGEIDGSMLKAYCLLNGVGCQQDQAQALSLINEVASTDTADLLDQETVCEANTQLGVMYSNATGVTQDYAKAMEFFRKAADMNSPKAMYYLGMMYENGYGVDVDYKEAMNQFMAAADHDYAPAQNQIGYLYFNGLGVDPDLSQAAYYQKLAAAQGYAQAQVNLGYMYENGYGVDQNLNTALAYYQMAAGQQFPGAEEAVTRVQTAIAAPQDIPAGN